MKLWTDDRRTTDGRTTDDRRRTTEPAYTISSPGAFGSGELKIHIHLMRHLHFLGLFWKLRNQNRVKLIRFNFIALREAKIALRPTNNKIIQRRDLSLKTHPKDHRRAGSNLGPLNYFGKENPCLTTKHLWYY